MAARDAVAPQPVAERRRARTWPRARLVESPGRAGCEAGPVAPAIATRPRRDRPTARLARDAVGGRRPSLAASRCLDSRAGHSVRGPAQTGLEGDFCLASDFV